MLKYQPKNRFKDRRGSHKKHHRGTHPKNLLTEEELRIYSENLENGSTSPESDHQNYNEKGKGGERKN